MRSGALARENKALILALVLVAQFMVALDGMITAVALPDIQRSLHFDAADLQWVFNAYTLAFGGFLLFGGRAGDLFGRLRFFVAGITLFTAASLVNGLATSSMMLVAGRAAQGLGGALVSPAVLSIILLTFSDGPERRRALGVFGGVNAAGLALGLLLGGVLTDALSWRWVFYVNVPVGVIGAALALRFIPESRAEMRTKTVDVAGALTVTGGLLTLVYAIVNAREWGWDSTQTLGMFTAAAALLSAFIVIELRSREPLVRLAIFAKRSLSVANAAMFLCMSALFTMLFFPTLYLQNILGFSPIETGLLFLPLPVTLIIAAGVGQQVMRRFGVRPAVLAGLALTGAAMFLFSGLSADGSYAADILPGLIVCAAGVGLLLPALTLVATTNVEGDEAGLASGIVNTSQQIGGSLGLAILSSLAASRTASFLSHLGGEPTLHDQMEATVAGFQRGFSAGAIMILVAVVLVALLLRRSDVAQLDAAEQRRVAFGGEPEIASVPKGATD